MPWSPRQSFTLAPGRTSFPVSSETILYFLVCIQVAKPCNALAVSCQSSGFCKISLGLCSTAATVDQRDFFPPPDPGKTTPGTIHGATSSSKMAGWTWHLRAGVNLLDLVDEASR